MTSWPPREGPRWGDDPPNPASSPAPPLFRVETPFDTLEKRYGLKNVASVRSDYERLRFDYPNCPLLKNGEEYFTRKTFLTIENTLNKYQKLGETISVSSAVFNFSKIIEGIIKYHNNAYDMDSSSYIRLGTDENFRKLLMIDNGKMNTDGTYNWDKMSLKEEITIVFKDGPSVIVIFILSALCGLVLETVRFYISLSIIKITGSGVNPVRFITYLSFIFVFFMISKHNNNLSRISTYISVFMFFIMFTFRIKAF